MGRGSHTKWRYVQPPAVPFLNPRSNPRALLYFLNISLWYIKVKLVGV